MSTKVEQINDYGVKVVRVTWTVPIRTPDKEIDQRVGQYIEAAHGLPAVVQRVTSEQRRVVTFILASEMTPEQLAGRAFSLAGPILNHTGPET